MRRGALVLLALAVLTGLLMALPGISGAATLSTGTYTYVINGEEVSFAYDPIKRSEGLLLPAELFQQLDLRVEGALTREVTISRPDVTVQTTLGSKTALVNGKARALATAPLQLGGRLFLPADLLPLFGVAISQDGNYVFLQEYLAEPLTLTAYAESAYTELQAGKRLTAMLRADSGIHLQTELTLLTRELLGAVNLDLTYGDRAHLLNLLETNTLVMVKLSNQSLRSGALQTGGLFLVDNLRNQYDLAGMVDIGKGLPSATLAPGADRVGVLLFPKLADKAQRLTLYYEANGTSVGNILNLE